MIALLQLNWLHAYAQSVYYELTDHFIVAADLDRTWAFFSDAENLPAITPPSLGFQIRTPRPIHMGADSVLDYTVRWAGLPIRWRTLIIDWSPPHRFADLQIRGPYALWLHHHSFEAAEHGTVCRDRVIYRLPVPVVGRLMHAVIVGRQLKNIFRFRRRVIADRLGWKQQLQEDIQIKRL